jgi:hypothetical protein
MAKAGNIIGRALGVAIVYVVLSALGLQMTSWMTSTSLGSFGVLAQIGLGLFMAALPFLAFLPELKNLF